MHLPEVEEEPDADAIDIRAEYVAKNGAPSAAAAADPGEGDILIPESVTAALARGLWRASRPYSWHRTLPRAAGGAI